MDGASTLIVIINFNKSWWLFSNLNFILNMSGCIHHLNSICTCKNNIHHAFKFGTLSFAQKKKALIEVEIYSKTNYILISTFDCKVISAVTSPNQELFLRSI